MKKLIMFSLMILTSAAGLVSTAYADDLTPQKTAAVLNRLIEINIDGEKGFREAADHVTSADLKTHFLAKSSERANFATELKDKVRQLGQDPEQTGSAVEAARRTWLDVKVAVTTNDDKAVLEVAKSQQAKAVAEYRSALRKNILEDARGIIAKQDEKIQDCYDWIKDELNDEHKEEDNVRDEKRLDEVRDDLHKDIDKRV